MRGVEHVIGWSIQWHGLQRAMDGPRQEAMQGFAPGHQIGTKEECQGSSERQSPQ